MLCLDNLVLYNHIKTHTSVSCWFLILTDLNRLACLFLFLFYSFLLLIKFLKIFVTLFSWLELCFGIMLWNYALEFNLFYFFIFIFSKQNIKSSWFIIWFKLFPVFYMRWKIYLFPVIFINKRLNFLYSLWVFCNFFMV